MPVIDSALLMDIDLGRDDAIAALHTLVESGEELIVPAQAALEYVGGLDDPDQGMHQLDLAFAVRPLDRAAILASARLGRAAMERGGFPGWADAQIGALAVLDQTFVVTADADHFRALGCRVWDYRNDARPPVE